MGKIEEKKGNIVRHIQSARQWLERAEHAVNTESSARGDLDLLLARAEVQLAQEKRSTDAQIPGRIMAYVLRPQNMLFIALGGMAVSVLLIFNMWHASTQGMNMYAVYAGRNKAPAELSASRELNKPVTSALPVSGKQGNEEHSVETNNETSEKHVPLLQTTKSDATVQRVNEPVSAVVQSPSASVSEQELRVLVRTAERVLKDTK